MGWYRSLCWTEVCFELRDGVSNYTYLGELEYYEWTLASKKCWILPIGVGSCVCDLSIVYDDVIEIVWSAAIVSTACY